MIRILDDRVINKIAAGEVVERPASALKELLENALDAGARDVRIELRSGGKALIRVSDDGRGMNRQDATLCIERHATSKIRTDEDLFRVATLGFRGEALPSIAAVSRFELLTRAEGEDVGTRVVVEGGLLTDLRDAGCARGTQVDVRTLFFNVPARRKFLRSEATELSHCLEAVIREALIRPWLDVAVQHDGAELLRAPRVADRAARAADLLGAHGKALVPVQFREGDLEVEALLSPVGVHRQSPQGATWLYVNGRYVQDRVLRRAVAEAYRGIVPKERHPTVVVEVRLPAEHVDVNVHPAKTEVRSSTRAPWRKPLPGACAKAWSAPASNSRLPRRPGTGLGSPNRTWRSRSGCRSRRSRRWARRAGGRTPEPSHPLIIRSAPAR